MLKLLLAVFFLGILVGEVVRRVMYLYFGAFYVPKDRIWKKIKKKINNKENDNNFKNK